MLYFGGGYPGVMFPPPALVVQLPPPPVPIDLVIEVPMLMATGRTTRPVLVFSRAEQAMAILPFAILPLTRGMSEQAEITMRVQTDATLEH